MNDIKFEDSDHFTGIEWWNMVEDKPYPIRYHVMISLLRYGQHPSDSNKITYHPYNSLISDNDANSKQYPIVFQDSRVMKGCIGFNVTTGESNAGPTYSM